MIAYPGAADVDLALSYISLDLLSHLKVLHFPEEYAAEQNTVLLIPLVFTIP